MPLAHARAYSLPGGNATNDCRCRPSRCNRPASGGFFVTMSTNLRRIPFVLTALLALLVTGQAVGAQDNGFTFKGEALNAQFSSVDANGIVTNVIVYADDQRYNVKGQGGPGER